jgi:hypothetical protein
MSWKQSEQYKMLNWKTFLEQENENYQSKSNNKKYIFGTCVEAQINLRSITNLELI